MYFSDFLDGFLIELGLVMTVGLQSAFILKQGIRREYVITAILTCFFGETLLVSIGIAGMGALVNSIPFLHKIVVGVGIVFLIFYGLKSFYSAIKSNDCLVVDNKETGLASWKEVLFAGLAFALLNPHVIIDTTLMGSLAARYFPHQWIFGAGVITAAFTWYVFLGTVGSALAKPLNNVKTWKVINVIIGIICIYMAVQFIKTFNSEEHQHNHINFFHIFGIERDIDMHQHEHGIKNNNHNNHGGDVNHNDDHKDHEEYKDHDSNEHHKEHDNHDDHEHHKAHDEHLNQHNNHHEEEHHNSGN